MILFPNNFINDWIICVFYTMYSCDKLFQSVFIVFITEHLRVPMCNKEFGHCRNRVEHTSGQGG